MVTSLGAAGAGRPGTCDVLGSAGTVQLLVYQPPWPLPPVGLTPHTPFCLLSSALFNFSGKPFPWSAVSRLTSGQGELPGQAVLENKSDLSQQSWYLNIFALLHLCEMVIAHSGVMGADTSLGLLSPVRVRPPGPSPWSARGTAQQKIVLANVTRDENQRKVWDERGLYLGLLPSGKVSAPTRTLSCT